MTWILAGLFVIDIGLTFVCLYVWMLSEENQRELEALNDWVDEIAEKVKQ